MTYCIAMRLREGLVFASDTRTNAGVDHIAVFNKMHTFQKPEDRSLVVMTSGNLATSQNVISRLNDQIKSEAESLFTVDSMHKAAELVGTLVRNVIAHYGDGQQNAGIDFGCNILLGGQIKGEGPRVFQIYPQGNYIEATEDTPYLQIGEAKYGKPIVDRIINYDTSIGHAIKCALISFDSTIRANLSVGMPLDFAVYRQDSYHMDPERIEENDEYFNTLRQSWGTGIKALFDQLP